MLTQLAWPSLQLPLCKSRLGLLEAIRAVLLCFLPWSRLWVVITSSSVVSLRQISKWSVENWRWKERGIPQWEKRQAYDCHGIVQASNISQELKYRVDCASVSNIDASSFQGEFEPKVFIMISIIQHSLSVVQSQEVVRLCRQGLEDSPLIVHKLSCVRGQISLSGVDLFAWHNTIVSEHVLSQSMNRCIRIWLIELEIVADDIDFDFTVVKIFIELLCVCTCKLTINLILSIASVEL